MIKDVLLVFKTHLDIGFTGYAADVKEKYCQEYLPAAIRVARENEGPDYKERRTIAKNVNFGTFLQTKIPRFVKIYN